MSIRASSAGCCLRLLLFVALLVAWAAESSASPVPIATGSVSGTVTSVDRSGAEVPESVTPGDTILLQFSYNPAAACLSETDVYSNYGYDVNLRMTATIDGLIWDMVTPGADVAGPISLESSSYRDYLGMTSSTVIGGHVGSGFTTNMGGACEVSFWWYDNVAPFDFISSVALPTTLSELNTNEVTSANGWIYAGCDLPLEGFSAIYFELDPSTLQLSTVPEPGMPIMSLAALIGISLAGRQRRRRS